MSEDSDLDAWVPPKSKMEEEIEESRKNSLIAIKEWIEAVTQKSLPYPDDLRKSLETGVTLCELLNVLKPTCIRKINRLKTPMASLDNLNVFFACCRKIFSIREGYIFDLHDLEDLSQRALDEEAIEVEVQKRLLKVAVCLFWVAKASEAFYSGPRLNYAAFSAIIADRGRTFASPRHSSSQPQSRNSEPLPHTAPVTSPKPRSVRPLFSSVDLTEQAEQQLKLVEANKKLKEEAMAQARMEEDDGWQSTLLDWREKRRQSSANYARALELKAEEEEKKKETLRLSDGVDNATSHEESPQRFQNLLPASNRDDVFQDVRASPAYSSAMHSVCEDDVFFASTKTVEHEKPNSMAAARESPIFKPAVAPKVPPKVPPKIAPKAPARHKMRTVNLTDTIKSTPGHPFGMGLSPNKDGAVVVHSVAAGSEADTCDVRVGDEIFSIDGADISGQNFATVLKRLSVKNARLQLKRQGPVQAETLGAEASKQLPTPASSKSPPKIAAKPVVKKRDSLLEKEGVFGSLTLQAVNISTDDSNFSSGFEEGRSSTTVTDNSSVESPEIAAEQHCDKNLSTSIPALKPKAPPPPTKPKPRKARAPPPPGQRSEVSPEPLPEGKGQLKETGARENALSDRNTKHESQEASPKKRTSEKLESPESSPKKVASGNGDLRRSENLESPEASQKKGTSEKPASPESSPKKIAPGNGDLRRCSNLESPEASLKKRTSETPERPEASPRKVAPGKPENPEASPKKTAPGNGDLRRSEKLESPEASLKKRASETPERPEASPRKVAPGKPENPEASPKKTAPGNGDLRRSEKRESPEASLKKVAPGNDGLCRSSLIEDQIQERKAPREEKASEFIEEPVWKKRVPSEREMEANRLKARTRSSLPPLDLQESPSESELDADQLAVQSRADLEPPDPDSQEAPLDSCPPNLGIGTMPVPEEFQNKEKPSTLYVAQVSHQIRPANNKPPSPLKSKSIESNRVILYDNEAKSRLSLASSSSCLAAELSTCSLRRTQTPDNLSSSLPSDSLSRSLASVNFIEKSITKSVVANCAACTKFLGNEVVTISLKKYGLFFHVTCFCCVKCSKALGDRSHHGGPHVLDSRLYCLRCHSAARGLRVLSLGKY